MMVSPLPSWACPCTCDNKPLSLLTMSTQVANPSVAALYEDALVYESGSAITDTGALTAYSGKKTGRSPLDKRIVKEPSSENDIWWGPVNKPMTPEVSPTFLHYLLFSTRLMTNHSIISTSNNISRPNGLIAPNSSASITRLDEFVVELPRIPNCCG